MAKEEIQDLILNELRQIREKLDTVVERGVEHEVRIKSIEMAHDKGNLSERAGTIIALGALIIALLSLIPACKEINYDNGNKTSISKKL